MKDFENDLQKLTENIEFTTIFDKFLNKLNEECSYLLIKHKIITENPKKLTTRPCMIT